MRKRNGKSWLFFSDFSEKFCHLKKKQTTSKTNKKNKVHFKLQTQFMSTSINHWENQQHKEERVRNQTIFKSKKKKKNRYFFGNFLNFWIFSEKEKKKKKMA